MTAKHQHYVYRYYLEKFVAEGKTFWVYDKKTGECRAQTPKNTAAETHIYSFEKDDGTKDDQLETKLFTPVENDAKSILDRWAREECVPTQEEIGIMLVFLALTHIRIPRHMAESKELAEKAALQILKDRVTNSEKFKEMWKGKTPWEETQRKILAFDESNISLRKNTALSFNLTSFEFLCLQLAQMSWAICSVPEKKFLVTSDSPLNVRAIKPNGKIVYGSGYGLQSVQIVFPLSPRKCVFLSHNEPQILGRACLKAQALDEFNRRCIFMADRFVISPFKSNHIKRLFEKYSETYGKPRIELQQAGNLIKVSPSEYDL